jgi:hypothetical protein
MFAYIKRPDSNAQMNEAVNCIFITMGFEYKEDKYFK